jgi:hypothetical protein
MKVKLILPDSQNSKIKFINKILKNDYKLILKLYFINYFYIKIFHTQVKLIFNSMY